MQHIRRKKDQSFLYYKPCLTIHKTKETFVQRALLGGRQKYYIFYTKGDGIKGNQRIKKQQRFHKYHLATNPMDTQIEYIKCM